MLLSLALITPLAIPQVDIANKVAVSQAKVSSVKSLSAIRKKIKKIKGNMGISKVNKILGCKPTSLEDTFEINGVTNKWYVWTFNIKSKKEAYSIDVKVLFSNGEYNGKQVIEYWM